MTATKLSDETIEALFCRLRRSGDWEEECDGWLDQWRVSRGKAGKGEWRWWAGPGGGGLYEFDFANREEAIAAGLKEYTDLERFEVIEARSWVDSVEEGDQISFAETRNHVVIDLEVDHD